MRDVPCLDKGFVQYIDHMGTDLSVVNAARVSFGKRKEVFDEMDKSLVLYLAENEHTSPFRHAYLTLHVKAPLFVKAQFDKHQIGVSINSLSGRYAEMKEEFYVPEVFRRQSKVNKQGSLGWIPFEDQGIAGQHYEHAIREAFQTYKLLLEYGVAREQARCVLPQALYTEFYMTLSLQAAAHFIHLRTDAHAQEEMQAYGRAFKEIVSELFPESLAALLAVGA